MSHELKTLPVKGRVFTGAGQGWVWFGNLSVGAFQVGGVPLGTPASCWPATSRLLARYVLEMKQPARWPWQRRRSGFTGSPLPGPMCCRARRCTRALGTLGGRWTSCSSSTSPAAKPFRSAQPSAYKKACGAEERVRWSKSRPTGSCSCSPWSRCWPCAGGVRSPRSRRRATAYGSVDQSASGRYNHFRPSDVKPPNFSGFDT